MLKKVMLKGLAKLRNQVGKFIRYPEWVAYEPNLIPPLSLMRSEGVQVLEEWFRWAEEWSYLLKIYGNVGFNSNVLEIGCGLGRTAFPLRYVVTNGTYDGFEICKFKVDFLKKNFTKEYSNFNFVWANINNSFYNPNGKINAATFRFPYEDSTFDIVYAASVFTHLLPGITENYFRETSRVLKRNGRIIFSFFVLDNYRKGHPRPFDFGKSIFDFDHTYGAFGNEFAISNPNNPEEMTAYSKNLIYKYATQAGLKLVQEPVTGLWSGSTSTWIALQDLIILTKD